MFRVYRAHVQEAKQAQASADAAKDSGAPPTLIAGPAMSPQMSRAAANAAARSLTHARRAARAPLPDEVLTEILARSQPSPRLPKTAPRRSHLAADNLQDERLRRP